MPASAFVMLLQDAIGLYIKEALSNYAEHKRSFDE
jgi:hypothetical protein